MIINGCWASADSVLNTIFRFIINRQELFFARTESSIVSQGINGTPRRAKRPLITAGKRKGRCYNRPFNVLEFRNTRNGLNVIADFAPIAIRRMQLVDRPVFWTSFERRKPVRYSQICPGTFISRPNRFIAMLEINGRIEACHVKNTGRCKELLTEGATLYLQRSENPNRKTKYDVIAVQKGCILINIDSQAPNQAAAEWLKGGGLLPKVTLLKPEIRLEDARLDFYLEAGNRRMYLEVKGVTLEADGMVLFPDAPTQRGIKHIHHLCRCVEKGKEAALLFVIQMKGVRGMAPNDSTHPEFGQALREAKRKGVRILARDCLVAPDSMTIADEIPVLL